MDSEMKCLGIEEDKIERLQENRVIDAHKSDAKILLVYTALLILSILTIWFFKHRKFKYLHATGLSIIYGLIIGAIVRYGSTPGSLSVIYKTQLPENSSTCSMKLPPDRIVLSLVIPDKIQNSSLNYEYTFLKDAKRDLSNKTATQLEEKFTFNPEIFFNLLLPPIIFSAGYSMKRRYFFQNFGAIITYAFIGTILSSCVVGGLCYGLSLVFSDLRQSLTLNDCLIFGSIISATDPVTVLAIFNDLNVDVNLYALVFGESVLNDAVAIVLSETIEKYSSIAKAFDWLAFLQCILTFFGVFLGSFAIGTAMGIVTAAFTKFTYLRDHPLLETALFFLMSYSTFLAAEAAGLTGIVAVLFCGITQAHYTYNNLSSESKHGTKKLFELLNFLSENFVFTYMGVSTFTFREHNWHGGFIGIALLAIIIGRLLNIYPLSFLLNLGRSNKISWNKQHMLMFSGLRGAMAFSLAIRNTSSHIRRMFLSTTLIIVIATVVLIGGLTTPMLQLLKIKIGADNEPLGNQKSTSNPDSRMLTNNYETISEPGTPATESSSPRHGKALLVKYFSNFDKVFLKPLLTHAYPPLTETMPGCCRPFTELLTTTEQLTGSAASLGVAYPPTDREQIWSRSRMSNDDDLILTAESVDRSDFIINEELPHSDEAVRSGSVTVQNTASGLINPVFSRTTTPGINNGYGDAV